MNAKGLLLAHLLTPFGRCSCGAGRDQWEIDDELPWAEHVTQMFKTAGLAVVELPESCGQDGLGPHFQGGGYGVAAQRQSAVAPMLVRAGLPDHMAPVTARKIAAALLAAANAAEEVGAWP